MNRRKSPEEERKKERKKKKRDEEKKEREGETCAYPCITEEHLKIPHWNF